MKKSLRNLFMLTTLLVLLVGLTAVSAADINDNSTTQTTSHVTLQDTGSTEEVSVADNDNKLQSSADKKIVEKENKTVDKRKSVKKSSTHIVNQSNWNESFILTDNSNSSNPVYSLGDNVNDKDTLDFQGKVALNVTLRFNKPVNVTSTTHDANLTLNTTAGSLLGTAPGRMFWVDSGAANSTFSNIYLYNTQFWVLNTTNVTFNNMSMVVDGARVGSGVGQTAIRGSTFITLNNCYVYTRDNGGSSSLVLTYSDYCTVNNCTVKGEGNVGNIFYFNKFNMDYDGNNTNSNNNVTNNNIIGGSGGISYGLAINGENNTIRGNKFNGAVGITMATSGNAKNYIVAGNEFNGGGGINLRDAPNSIITDNIINGGALLFTASSVVRNNTANVAQMIAAPRLRNKVPVEFVNNTITEKLAVREISNVYNNSIYNIVVDTRNAMDSNITFNNISGTVDISRATNINFSNNTVDNNDNYSINVTTQNNIISGNYLVSSALAGNDSIISKGKNIITDNTPEPGLIYNITDDTYNNYFNVNGVMNTSVVGNYSKLYLQGDFYNRNFTFNNTKVNIIGENTTLYNSSITSVNNAIISASNIKINNQNSNDKTVILKSDNNRIINFTIKQDTDNSANIIIVTGLNNIIENNTITVNSKEDITAINITSDNNKINTNKIRLNTTAGANAIKIKSDELINSQVTHNNIEINSKTAHGILLENVNLNLLYNKIVITADKTNGIESYFKNNTASNQNMTSNNITIKGSNTTGILIKAKDITIRSNNITLTAENNPNNTAILLEDSDNITLEWGNNITAANASALILINTNNTEGKVQGSWLTTNTPVILLNSNNNNFNRSLYINSTSQYSITLTNSSNNIIERNNLNASNQRGGNDAVSQDTQSTNNTITRNSPKIYILTNQTYPTLFDENSNLISNELNIILSLASDLHNLDIKLNQSIHFLNLGNYTIYNGTIELTQTETTNTIIEAININNTDKPAILVKGNLTNGERYNIKYVSIHITGENITAITAPETAQQITLNINNTNITLNGKNATVYNNHGQKTTYLNMYNSGINLTAQDTVLITDVNTCSFNLYNNNITMTGKTSTTTRQTRPNNGNINYNNINITGEIITLITLTQNNTYTYNIQYNNIILNTNKSTTAITINGDNSRHNTNHHIQNNMIILNTANENIPVISITNTTTGYVRNNYIQSLDVTGNDAVNNTGIKIQNNTPDNNTGYLDNININVNSTVINHANPVTVTVTDVFGNPVNGTVTITIDGNTTTVNASETTVNYTPKTSGNITINVDFTDNTGKYLNNTKTVTVNIPKLETTVNILNITGVLDDTVTFTAVITDNNGENVTDGKVIFLVNGSQLTDANGNIIYADVTGGVASLNYTVPYTWINANNTGVEYIGNDVYTSSDNTGSITVNRKTVNMKVEVLNNKIRPGETAIIMVTVTDKYGNMVKSGKVVFKLNGKTIKDSNGTAVTIRVHNGIAIFKYVIPAGYSAKNYTLTAVSVGNTYNRAEATTNISLTKINTYIQNVNTYFTGNTLHVKADIISTTTQKNTAYRETKVTVKINNKTFAKEVKITNGTIDLNIDTTSIGRGNYKITIKAGENGIYNGSQFDTYTYKAPVKSTLNQTSSNGTVVKA